MALVAVVEIGDDEGVARLRFYSGERAGFELFCNGKKNGIWLRGII